MVTTIQGLKAGPGVPRAFGSEFRPLAGPIRRGDEVRCVRDGRDIYVDVLGVAPDGWLLGFVVTVGDAGGSDLSGIRIGDLVEFRSDRVWAFLRFDAESQCAASQGCQ